jgi:hypothetical protein
MTVRRLDTLLAEDVQVGSDGCRRLQQQLLYWLQIHCSTWSLLLIPN